MSEPVLSHPGVERLIRRRTRKDPKPHFKPDTTAQLDAIAGCPAYQVPADHLARAVKRIVGRLDLSAVEAQYSSLGRHGFGPRNLLAVWVYASLIGLHHGTQLARALKTDVALRLLSGGHAISRSKLNAFRQQHGALFEDCVAQTVAMAQAEGLLALDDLAADSMRLRAHASTKAIRTRSRSQKRLAELATVDERTLSEAERETHRAKVKKHTQAVAACEARGRSSVVTTNPSAVLMKFPDGAGVAGHRISTVASGVQARFIVAVLVSADTNDYGLLEPLVEQTQKQLAQLGVPAGTKLQIAADAGYCAQADLAFAARVRERIDLLIDGAHRPEGSSRGFGRERFTIHADGTATCPAGRAMHGPRRHSDEHTMWTGIGCSQCPLRPECTKGRTRTLLVNVELDRLREAMQARLAEPGAKARYNRRIATVEPVFSNIESTMGYRRASSRFEQTIVAEVMLKVLAHNLSRLLAARRLSRVYCQVTESGTLRPLQPSETQFLATL